jgi:phosphocarrier protein
MFEKKMVIRNKTGLHARPASEMVRICQPFESEVLLLTEDEEINAKSIISILSGGVYNGTEITLKISGPDEESAGKTIVHFLENLPD